MKKHSVSELDAALLQLTQKDSLRDAPNGVQVRGGIGSGKHSFAGPVDFGAYLRAGMGGLVLCAKPEEVDLWISYCKQHGRAQDTIVFDESQGSVRHSGVPRLFRKKKRGRVQS